MRIIFLVFFLKGLVAFGQPIDFSKFNFDTNGNQVLKGPWQFHFGDLLNPTDTTRSNATKSIYTPHAWLIDGHEMYGVGSYQIKLKLPVQREGQLAVFIPYVRTAGRVYVNGYLMDSVGTVGSKEIHKSHLGSTLIPLPNQENVDIQIDVSNYEFRWGGLGTIQIGKLSALRNSQFIRNSFDIFFVGSLLAMSLYLVTMYFLYREGYSFLFLSLICLAVVLRTLTTESSSLLLPALFPDFGWGLWKKIEFFSVYSITAFFPLYVSHVFPNESNKRIDIIFGIVASLLCLTVIFTSHSVYVLALDVCHVGLLLGFVYACVVTFKAWRNKNSDARTLLIGILVAFPFIFLEILKNSALQIPIPFTHLVEFGVLSFLLFQVYVLANHYAMTYQQLEVVVKNKTAELIESNEIKNKMLAILSHDIRGPVNNLKAVLNMFNKGHLSLDEMRPMTMKIERQAGNVSLLIENILLLVKSQLNGIVIKKESFALGDWVKSHYTLYNLQAQEKDIRFRSDIPDHLTVKADKNVVSLVVRNLIANAIKFSNRGTEIHVTGSEVDDLVLLSVIDTGKGMTPEQVQAIFTRKASIWSVSGTEKETGIGLGLKLCREYLLEMGSDLEIKSTPGVGTKVSIALQRG